MSEGPSGQSRDLPLPPPCSPLTVHCGPQPLPPGGFQARSGKVEAGGGHLSG